MAYNVPSQCPVCARQLVVSHMQCENCGTELRGRFELCRFCALPPQHLQVIETYLRCRGNVKELERAMGVSYPTARAALDAAFAALGFEQESADRPDDALEALERGEIGVDQALEQIRKRK